MILLSDEEKLAVVGGRLEEDPWEVDVVSEEDSEHPWGQDLDGDSPWDVD